MCFQLPTRQGATTKRKHQGKAQPYGDRVIACSVIGSRTAIVAPWVRGLVLGIRDCLPGNSSSSRATPTLNMRRKSRREILRAQSDRGRRVEMETSRDCSGCLGLRKRSARFDPDGGTASEYTSVPNTVVEAVQASAYRLHVEHPFEPIGGSRLVAAAGEAQE